MCSVMGANASDGIAETDAGVESLAEIDATVAETRAGR